MTSYTRPCTDCGAPFQPRRDLDKRCKTCAARRRVHGSPTRPSRSPAARAATRAARTSTTLYAGVDGEGINVTLPDGTTRHDYVYMAAVYTDGRQFELYDGDRPLSTQAMLTWLMALPQGSLWFYSSGYDWTRILSGLPPEVLAQVYATDREDPFEPVRWGRFGITFVQGAVTLTDYAHSWTDRQGETRHRERFFQDGFRCWNAGSFVSKIEEWQIGDPAERGQIAAMKERRSAFTTCDQAVREYCLRECAFLADLAYTVCTTAADAGIAPRRWYSAGSGAKALLRSHRVHDHRGPDRWAGGDGHVRDVLDRAFFGGRFETAGAGVLPVLYPRDIASAYPAVTVGLPCLAHGHWTEGIADDAVVTLLHVSWTPARLVGGLKDQAALSDPVWGPLPWRWTDGRVTYPIAGEGWYHAAEVMAASGLPWYDFTVHDVISFVPSCEHRPLEWVAGVYDQRIQLGKAGKGLVLKVALNSIYGTFADTVSENAALASTVWASMITAGTRAKILRVLSEYPWDVVSIATDGIAATRPVIMEQPEPGDPATRVLGEWEPEPVQRDVLVVQPGLSLALQGQAKPKTRGHAWRDMVALEGDLRRAWEADGWDAQVVYTRSRFIPARLALKMKDFPGCLGQWRDTDVRVSFKPPAWKRLTDTESSHDRDQNVTWKRSWPWAAHLTQEREGSMSHPYRKLIALQQASLQELKDAQELDESQP